MITINSNNNPVHFPINDDFKLLSLFMLHAVFVYHYFTILHTTLLYEGGRGGVSLYIKLLLIFSLFREKTF